MKESIVSFFCAPVRNKTPYCACSIAGIRSYILANDDLKQRTEQVRKDLPNKDVFKLKKLSLLPYVSPGGVFSRCCRDGLLIPSGDFVIDIDELPSYEEACRLRHLLAADKQLQPDLVFVSPSMHGIKLFVPYRIAADLPVEECLRQAIEASWEYLEAIYDLHPDRANTDICRGCILCHDPQATWYGKEPENHFNH